MQRVFAMDSSNLEDTMTAVSVMGQESYSDSNDQQMTTALVATAGVMQSNIAAPLSNHPAELCATSVPYMTPIYQTPMGYVPPFYCYNYMPAVFVHAYSAPVAAEQMSYYYPYPPPSAQPAVTSLEMVPAYMTHSPGAPASPHISAQSLPGANHLPPSAIPTYLTGHPHTTASVPIIDHTPHTHAQGGLGGVIYLQHDSSISTNTMPPPDTTSAAAAAAHRLPLQPHQPQANMSSSVPYGLQYIHQEQPQAGIPLQSNGPNNLEGSKLHSENQKAVMGQNANQCWQNGKGRGRGFTTERKNRDVKSAGKNAGGGRKQMSNSCTTTPYVSSVEEFVTSGTESCKEHYHNNSTNGSASTPRKPRRRSRKKSAGMNGASSSESLNVPPDHQKTCNLIPLSVHKGPVLNLDSEEFPGLPQGVAMTHTTNNNSTLNDNIVPSSAPTDATTRASSAGGALGWSKQGSDVLKAPYKPVRSIASQTNFGTQLSFLTLQQCSTMYKEGKAASCGEVGSGNVGVLGCSVNAAAALLDNDSGYSSPKTRPSDSTEQNDTTQNVHLATASIGVSVAPPVPAVSRVSAVSGASDRNTKPLQPVNSQTLTPQQQRKKKKRASSRKKRGTLTMDNVNATTTDATEEDIDLLAQIDHDFPALVSSQQDKPLVKPAKVTLGAGLQAYTQVKQQSATAWKCSSGSGEKHQATILTHTHESSGHVSVNEAIHNNDNEPTTTSGAKINIGMDGADVSMRTPIVVSTSVSQSIKAAAAKNITSSSAITSTTSATAPPCGAGKPTKELPLTAFIKEQPSTGQLQENNLMSNKDTKSVPKSRPDKGVALSDGEIVNGYSKRFDTLRNDSTVHTNPRPSKKGKQRETPKPKKPSALKKVILQERQDRKKLREDCLINNENPPPVVNDQTVLSMDQTLEKNMTDVYSSVLDTPVFDSATPASVSRNGLSLETTEDEDNFCETLRDPLCLRTMAATSDGPTTDSEPRLDVEQSEDNEAGSCYSSTSHLSSHLPASTIPSRSGSATTLFSLPEFPSGCWTSDSDCPYMAPNIGKVKREVLPKIHNRKFREYCNQVVSKEINTAAKELLQKLCAFQDKAYSKTDVTKIKYKRRLVLGLKEVKKHLEMDKLKLVIFSPSLEKVGGKGGLDEMLDDLICLTRDRNTPFVFALSRKEMGSATNKIVPVSCVGIFNYQGAESYFNKLMDLTETARDKYKELVIQCQQEATASNSKFNTNTTPEQLRSQSCIAEHPLAHYNPLRIVTSFSCDEIDEQVISKQFGGHGLQGASPFASFSGERFSQVCENKGRFPENATTLNSTEDIISESYDKESYYQLPTAVPPKTKAFDPQTVAPSVVAHQEITLNISISDSVQSNSSENDANAST